MKRSGFNSRRWYIALQELEWDGKRWKQRNSQLLAGGYPEAENANYRLQKMLARWELLSRLGTPMNFDNIYKGIVNAGLMD